MAESFDNDELEDIDLDGGISADSGDDGDGLLDSLTVCRVRLSSSSSTSSGRLNTGTMMEYFIRYQEK